MRERAMGKTSERLDVKRGTANQSAGKGEGPRATPREYRYAFDKNATMRSQTPHMHSKPRVAQMGYAHTRAAGCVAGYALRPRVIASGCLRRRVPSMTSAADARSGGSSGGHRGGPRRTS